MEEPRIASSPSIWMRIPDEQLRHHFVEIRDAVRGHSLVTLIEIASPTNKRRGPDRQSYEAKRQEVVDSDTSLIEIDLLRGGQPLVGGPLVIEAAGCLEPQPDYLVVVNRAWHAEPNCNTSCSRFASRSRCHAYWCRCARARRNRRSTCSTFSGRRMTVDPTPAAKWITTARPIRPSARTWPSGWLFA